MKTHRIIYIDRLRGLAVIAMFFVHSASAWMLPDIRYGTNYGALVSQISGMVAPIFMFLAGISISLLALKKIELHGAHSLSPHLIKINLCLRGFKIFLLGYALHFSFWIAGECCAPFIKVFKVDILHCIGLSIMVFPWIIWPKPGRTNWLALLIFIIFLPAGSAVHYFPLDQYLAEPVLAYVGYFSSISLFPVIPYSGWVALGLFIGPFIAGASTDAKKTQIVHLLLLATGVILLLLSKEIKWLIYHFHIYDYIRCNAPKSKGVLHVLIDKAAYTLIIFSLFGLFVSHIKNFKYDPVLLFGKTALFSYSIHLFIVYHHLDSLLMRRFSIFGHFAMFVLLSICMYGLAFTWIKRKYLTNRIKKNLFLLLF